MASIKDVAQRAGVSTATVSRMMANKGYISEATRARVQKAVDDLDYRPNRVAQRLRERHSRILALIVSDIQNPFFGKLSRAIEKHSHSQGLNVFICNTDEDPEKEAHYLDQMLQEKVAGIIISPTRNALAPLRELRKKGIPIVTVDRQVSAEFDSVLIDNAEASRRLTTLAIQKGYRKIAGLFGANSFTAEERLKGFREALKAANLQPLAIERPAAFQEEGRKAMDRLLQHRPQPDAVICSSALIATGAFEALNESGTEIGFGCFDDLPWSTLVTPRITVISQPTDMIGETAYDLLRKRMKDPKRTASHIRLQGELIERESLRGAEAR
ncbi:LacI family DNA-binding transcriptional regulator [Puniceicoccus vermicola]|uniref:LacI family DNA-binding transcriptional regulator n=1 Tax=Puniceicoccus vermicola TaxID=388746 RepID=A0A7X1E5C9_9BACT|nr:LacI family DNA-binding transcriptional regulator [Puniceicoccus vermicola]MBC2602898.1 LacI family DNA-binding transcriptional regulator [Puniceicoccus vermicola]